MARDSQSKEAESRRQSIPGMIFPEAMYRVDELRMRMGWAASAYRAACQRGLPVRYSGKRAYVLGADVIAFVSRDSGMA
jgi:hypothetical protein